MVTQIKMQRKNDAAHVLSERGFEARLFRVSTPQAFVIRQRD